MSDYTSEEIQEVYRKRREHVPAPKKEVYPYPYEAKGQKLLNATLYTGEADGVDYEWTVLEFEKGVLVHEFKSVHYDSSFSDFIYKAHDDMPDDLKQIFYNDPNQ